MADFPMTIPDVLASTDVLVDVQNASDSMTAEQCIEYRRACEEVLNAAKTAIDLLDMQFIKISETDVVQGGMRYYVGHKKDRVRFDHDTIEAAVVRQTMLELKADYGGDMPGGTDIDSARRAAHLMRHIYVTDSTSAKTGALHGLGLNTDRDNPRSVRTWEKGAKIVTAVPAGGET